MNPCAGIIRIKFVGHLRSRTKLSASPHKVIWLPARIKLGPRQGTVKRGHGLIGLGLARWVWHNRHFSFRTELLSPKIVFFNEVSLQPNKIFALACLFKERR